MLCWKKDSLYRNPKASVINVTNYSLIDFNNPFTGTNFRPYNPINYCLETESLVGSKNIIDNKTIISSKHYWDLEEVLEYRDVVIFKLACQEYSKRIYDKNEYRFKSVLIDKTYNFLIIFDSVDDMFNYISGIEFNYCYGISLNSYINLTLCKPRCIKNIKFPINKNNKSKLYECTLIENDHNELIKYNVHNHFNNFIKINKLYKFSSVYSSKMKLFKETIEKIVGFKIIYDD